MKSVIKNSPIDKSFTIGLFGEWGSGKSSIIKTVKKELKEDSEERIKFIIYDAWKYANDSFRRMFLLKVQEMLKFERTDLMNSFYLNESEDVEIKKQVNSTNLIIIILIMIIGIITINNLPSATDGWKLSLSIFISFLGLITTILFKAFDEFKVNIQKPHFFAPEQFEECFNEMLSKSMKKQSLLSQAYQYVKGDSFEKNINKLVIVIDNIDRCSKELAYQLLTDTKSFLGNAKNIVFLIPVDDVALKKHIEANNTNNKEAEEFLRKFFNTTIRIKPFKPIDLFDFANNLNDRYDLNFNHDTIDIIAKEYATNPRRIIQFFNNLVVELNNFRENFSKTFVAENESLICKLLIIREEWPIFYKQISNKPHLIKEDSESLNEKTKITLELQMFLRNTKAISKNIDISIFEKLLSNNNVFKELNQEILDSINDQDFAKIENTIKQDSPQKTKIINYVIEELRKGIDSKRYSILTVKMFNSLLFINNIVELSVHENHRIQNIVEDELNHFIEKVEVDKKLTNYIDTLEAQENNYLSEYLINLIHSEYLKDNSIEEDAIDKFVSDILINIVSNSETNDLISRLRTPFFKYFQLQDKSLSSLIESKKINYIFTNDLFEYIVFKLKQINIDSEEYNDIIFIASNFNLSGNNNEKFFERMNLLFPSFTNKNKKEILTFIKHCHLFVSKIKYSTDETRTELKTFVNNLFSNRTVANRSVNLIAETITVEDEIIIIVEFLTVLYNSTSGSLNSVLNYFKTISKTNRVIVNKSFILLKNTYNYSLSPLFDIIISDTSYEEVSFELLKQAFTYEGEENALSDEKLKSKIAEMSNIIFSSSEKSERIILFFEELIFNNRIAEILSNIITGKSKDEILKLSRKLLKLSFDMITKDDMIFEYQNDIEVLKAIAETGEKIHLTKLTKVIVSKLQKEETYDEAFEIIKVSKEFNDRDTRNIINNLETLLDNEVYREKVKNIIDEYLL